MQALMYLLLIVLGLTGLIVSSVAICGWLLKRSSRRMRARHSVSCPHLRQSMDCTLSWDARTSRWGTVERCPVFVSSGEVLCDQSCLRRLTQQANERLARPSPASDEHCQIVADEKRSEKRMRQGLRPA
jgi:hypothetical protein